MASEATSGKPAAKYNAWKPDVSWKWMSASASRSLFIASMCPSSAAARSGVRPRVTYKKRCSSSNIIPGKLAALWVASTSTPCLMSVPIVSTSFDCAASKSANSSEKRWPSISKKRLFNKPKNVMR